MIRLNLVLLVAVMASAFYLVHTQYESRRLYTAIDKAQAQTRRLEADHEQLQVQKREQATPARVQQLAARQLQMRPVNPGITEYVGVTPAAGAAATPTAGGSQ
ncbi:MAG: cell division protein FtsL [Hydrogenophaga sp.]|nr:cell division protein FtsL [Hydrogenophaga sp.]